MRNGRKMPCILYELPAAAVTNTNKHQQTWCLQTTQIYYLEVLEVRSLKWSHGATECRQGWFLLLRRNHSCLFTFPSSSVLCDVREVGVPMSAGQQWGPPTPGHSPFPGHSSHPQMLTQLLAQPTAAWGPCFLSPPITPRAQPLHPKLHQQQASRELSDLTQPLPASSQLP